MPTYEYRCPAGHDFEKFYRKISDAPAEVACPDCGVIAERRLSAGAGLLFKGSGFYITDYGKDGKGARKEPAGGADSKGGEAKGGDAKSGESKSGESKPAAGGSEAGAASKAEGSAAKSSESKKSSGGTGGSSSGSSGGSAGGAS